MSACLCNMRCAVTGTEAITGARTHGAVQKSRWKGPARIQRHSSSLTMGSIYTMHTHTSYWTSNSMLIHLPRSLKEPFQKPKKHQNKPKSTQRMPPALLPCLAQAQLRNQVWKQQVREGCLKTWCLIWFGIHQTTTCLQIPHLTLLPLPLRLGLPTFPIHVSILPWTLAPRESLLFSNYGPHVKV